MALEDEVSSDIAQTITSEVYVLAGYTYLNGGVE